MNYSFSKALTAFFFASLSVILAGTALAAESVDELIDDKGFTMRVAGIIGFALFLDTY
jgi:hypothetical protein